MPPGIVLYQIGIGHYFSHSPRNWASLLIPSLTCPKGSDDYIQGFETKTCPFKNLPVARRGQWGEGLTAEDMEKCRWLKPRLVASIEYLEWTAANHLRHPKFAGLTEN
jgi:hypothetical protein